MAKLSKEQVCINMNTSFVSETMGTRVRSGCYLLYTQYNLIGSMMRVIKCSHTCLGDGRRGELCLNDTLLYRKRY